MFGLCDDGEFLKVVFAIGLGSSPELDRPDRVIAIESDVDQIFYMNLLSDFTSSQQI